MIDIALLGSKVVLLLILMLCGLVLKKTGICSEEAGRNLSNIVLYIGQVALIINAYVTDFSTEILKRAIAVFLFSLLAHIFFIAVAFLCFGKVKNVGQAKVLLFATIFTNAGFMGIPLICSLLGNEAGIYSSIYVIAFNLVVWTFGCLIFTGDKKYISPKKAVLNPAFIATAIGLVIFISPLNHHLPVIVTDALTSLQVTVAPLSMFVVGFGVSSLKLKGLITDFKMIAFIVLRMLILPTAVFGILFISKIIGIYYDETVFIVVLLSASTPSAAMTSMFAEKFHADIAYASKLVSVSTILSVVTMPIVALLLYLL